MCIVSPLSTSSTRVVHLLHFFFLSFGAASAAGGGSQVRGQIKAVASSLHHSPSNAGSKPCLWPTHSSQQCRILNWLSEARDRTCILMDASQFHFCWATTGLQEDFFLKKLGCLFSYHWVLRVLCIFGIFWITVLYQVCLSQIFSPSL